MPGSTQPPSVGFRGRFGADVAGAILQHDAISCIIKPLPYFVNINYKDTVQHVFLFGKIFWIHSPRQKLIEVRWDISRTFLLLVNITINIHKKSFPWQILVDIKVVKRLFKASAFHCIMLVVYRQVRNRCNVFGKALLLCF